MTTGAAAVAGEEDRRTLDLLLANPVSRGRVVLEKLVAMTVGIILLAGVTATALLTEGNPADMSLPIGPVVAAMVHLALLALVFGTLAGAVGSSTGSLTAARGVPAVLAVIADVVNGLGPQASWLEPVQKFSPFYQYAGHDPLTNGLSVPAVLVALGTVGALAAVGVAGFRRRDVSA